MSNLAKLGKPFGQRLVLVYPKSPKLPTIFSTVDRPAFYPETMKHELLDAFLNYMTNRFDWTHKRESSVIVATNDFLNNQISLYDSMPDEYPPYALYVWLLNEAWAVPTVADILVKFYTEFADLNRHAFHTP